jgi:hypothetical protein
MAQKDSGEIKGGVEGKIFYFRELNKFLSDYFNWVVAGIVAVIFIAGFFFLLLPKYQQTVNYLRVFNKQQLSDNSAKQDELNKIQQLIASYNSIDKSSIDKVNAIAPIGHNQEELFTEFNHLIASYQLFLNSISISVSDGYTDKNLMPITPADAAIAAGLRTAHVSISINGLTSYDSFKGFLTAMENNLHLMDILNVTYGANSRGLELSIDTYYSKN